MRKTILTAAIILCAATLSAQNPGGQITQQIEVTKEYVPEISGARKLYFQPQIGDTITLKPDIDYSITPTPWKSIFGTEPITPVDISTAEYRPARPYYIKAAAGYPFQTALDFYAGVPCDPSRGRFGVYANHYGQWSKLPNMEGTKVPSSWTENKAGIFGGAKIGRRMLDADVNYGYRYYMPSEYPAIGSELIDFNPIVYNNVDAVIKFGDAFTDFSRFNYRFGLSGSWMRYSNKTMDSTYERNYADEYRSGIFADFGWGLGKGVLLTGVKFDGWFFNNADERKTRDWYIGLNPEYKLDIKSFSMSIGLKAYYRNYNYNNRDTYDKSPKSKMYVLPDIQISYKFLPVLEPYINIDGELCDGSLAAMSKQNPYVVALESDRPVYVDFKGGIRGSASGIFTYDAFVGYTSGRMPVFYYYFTNFLPATDKTDWFYAGARAKVSLACGFGAEVFGQYNSIKTKFSYYSPSDLPESLNPEYIPSATPEFTAGFGLSYNYKNKLYVKAGLEYVGKRGWLALSSDAKVEYVPSTLNLTASVEYLIQKRFAVFVTGDNLLNANIYRYLGYRALGANVMAGVRFNF